jgi:nucleotide-binding universal stress UspA family protein
MTPANGQGRRGRARAGTLRILSDVLCGVDGTRTSYEAVRQAASLTGPNGQLSLLAVVGERAPGAERDTGSRAATDNVHMRRALDYARDVARREGVPVESDIDRGRKVADALLDRARSHSLLAVGAPAMSRMAHLLVGGITSAAVHRLPASLLIARRAPSGVAFAGRILVAGDASAGSDKLLDFGMALALEREAELLLVHAAGRESRFQPARLGRQAQRVGESLGHRGQMRVVPGRPEPVIIDAARQARASLIITSSRQLRGARALASLSERLVHNAPCSVLVMRPQDLGA